MSGDGLLIKNGQVVTPSGLQMSSVLIKNGRIQDLGEQLEKNVEILDAQNCYVTPGLIDLQVNGSPQCNLWGDPDAGDLMRMRKEMLKHGVTSFLPTLITDDIEHLKKNIDFLNANGVSENGSQAMSRMPGIHLEGPCLSPRRPGVHPPQYLQPLNLSIIKEIVRDNVKLITLAPELDPSGEAVSWLVRKNVAVSLGHSDATFEEAQSAFQKGVKLVTHLFNAMPPLHHRAPGAVGAAFLDDGVSVCLIADGLHLSPDTVKLILKIKSAHKAILVTDIATVGTKDGGLVGSSITLDQAVQNVVSWGACDFVSAIHMATCNAARAVGLENVGSIERNKVADILLWDRVSLKLKRVIFGGKLLP